MALGDIDLLCVAGVALGDIHLHFAWQAWRHRPPHFAWTPVKRFARVMEQTPEDTELLKMPSEYGRFLCVSMRLMRGAKISRKFLVALRHAKWRSMSPSGTPACADKSCVSKLCASKLCVSKLCVDKLCVDKLCVIKLCVFKSCLSKLCVSKSCMDKLCV